MGYNSNNKLNTNSKTSQSEGIILGRNPVTEAIKANKTIDSVYINANAKGSISVIVNLCRENGIVVKRVDDKKLDKMSGGASHQGVIAMLGCAEYCLVSDILDNARQKGEDPFIIICDEIEDPHNLGEAVGVHGIIIPKRRSASLSSTVYKTSAGAASHVLVARVSNLSSAIDELKQNGVWIYGTDASGDDYTSVSLKGAAALVIGSEGFGMGRLIKEKCDFLLKLPMFGKINSLNASVAAGVFMYEAVRQRRQQ